MTVRCQLLVLLFLVSSVVSGPTRSAAESPDDPSSAPAPEGPGEAMPSQKLETPAAPVLEPSLAQTQATVAPETSETTTKTGPEVVAKISLTESNASANVLLNEPTPPAPETASSAPLETRVQLNPPEDSLTGERCTEPASGNTEGSATGTCSSSKNTEGGSTDNSCVIDGQEYPDGARVSGPQDPCRPCFCHRKRVTCVELRCYTRKGCKPLFKAGVCCPTYDHCPPVALVNASTEIERTDGLPEEDTTRLEDVTTDQLTDESVTGTSAHLVNDSAHGQDDSEDQSTSDHDQDDDDGDDHDHSYRHHKQHHMLDPVTPLTSSAATLHPTTSFPFLVRGRIGVEV